MIECEPRRSHGDQRRELESVRSLHIWRFNAQLTAWVSSRPPRFVLDLRASVDDGQSKSTPNAKNPDE